MKYYIDLFTPETANHFRDSQHDVTGFRISQKSYIHNENIGPGDRLICYVIGISRFIGILEITSGSFISETPIFQEKNDPFIVRFKVKPLVWLPVEKAIPIHDDLIWNNLSFTKNLPKNSTNWTNKVLGSPKRWPRDDSEFLEKIILAQSKALSNYPFTKDDKRKLKLNKNKITVTWENVDTELQTNSPVLPNKLSENIGVDLSVDLILNNLYSKEEIETAFTTDFGPRIKGITLRRSEQDNPYIILFATVKGAIAYGDIVDGNIFYYKGEGADGDQILTPANKALINSTLDNKPIYGFRQEEEGGKYKYLGLISLLDWAYINYGGRKVYNFKFQQEGINNVLEQTKEWQELKLESELPEAELRGPGERSSSTVFSIARDNAFRLQIKILYQNRCVVCGKKRLSIAGYPEVQAAHIFPKEKNGADDWRNGIALCRLHHWAFDSGLLAISDDLKIIVCPEIKDQVDYEEIYCYEGNILPLPNDVRYKPIPLFLSAHREIHGF